jgi:hypothetical protein
MMRLDRFLEAASSWEDLGWAVQAQVHDLLDGNYSEPGDLNENAVKDIALFADTLYSYFGIDTNELHAAIDRYEALDEEDFLDRDEDWVEDEKFDFSGLSD